MPVPPPTTHVTSFREFLLSQPDGIADDEAVARYAAYKTTTTRNLLRDIFEQHRASEWFRERYDPASRHEVHERYRALPARRRAEIFQQRLAAQTEPLSLELPDAPRMAVFAESGARWSRRRVAAMWLLMRARTRSHGAARYLHRRRG